MNKLNHYNHSGHCYPELVQKKDGKVIAQAKATLWNSDYERINTIFMNVLKEPLKDGIKILFLAKITFTPIHGLALQILDMDPSYTLGDLEREKQETITRLREEGTFDTNRYLRLPPLPRRLAVISVESSRGYADFLSVLQHNPWGYKVFHMLFPSLLQGEQAVEAIIVQLRQIRKVITHFDAVAIVRGGGGDIGLSCYNNYRLANEVARFPIPVLTGIGHATNETVVEMIANVNAITPTRLAEFILQQFNNFAVPVANLESEIRRLAEDLIRTENENFMQLANRLSRQTAYLFRSHRDELFQAGNAIQRETKTMLQREITQVAHVEKIIHTLDPVNLLRRGYSITTLNGKIIRNAAEAKPGDSLKSILFTGAIDSTVTNTTDGNE